jgi:hypothetical protein
LRCTGGRYSSAPLRHRLHLLFSLMNSKCCTDPLSLPRRCPISADGLHRDDPRFTALLRRMGLEEWLGYSPMRELSSSRSRAMRSMWPCAPISV